MMKQTKILAGVLLASAFLQVGAARAGQVVTDADRSWAKKAVSEEKALGAAEGKNTVAVLYFRNGTGQGAVDPLQKGMALMLVTDLSQVPDLQVVERVKLQALAEELGLGTSGLVEPGSAPRVGKLRQARWIVGGDIAKGEKAPLDVRENVADVPTTETLGRPASQGSLNDVFRIEKDLLFETIKLLKIEVTPEVRRKLEKPCSKSPAALLALARGVDESDRGNYADAAGQYEAALKEDPGVCLAGDSLRELQDRGLVPPRKGKGGGTLDVLQELKDASSVTNQITTKDQVRTIVNPGSLPSRVNGNVTFP